MPTSRQMTDTTDGPHAIFWPVRDVRFVPKADSCTAQNSRYSITSSAVASSAVGISKPSIMAVVRLIANSNLFACSTGMSLRFHPAQNLVDHVGGTPEKVRVVRAIRHEFSSFDIIAVA